MMHFVPRVRTKIHGQTDKWFVEALPFLCQCIFAAPLQRGAILLRQ